MARAFFPVIVVFLIRSFWVEPFKILPIDETHAAGGRLHPGEQYTYGIRLPVLNRKVVEINPIRRGDVVVFRYPSDPSVDYIKRVGACQDKVVYRGKRLTINGESVPVNGTGFYTDAELNYLRLPLSPRNSVKEPPDDDRSGAAAGGPRAGPAIPHRGNCEYNHDGFSCTVPAGNYFMMGDNRDQSSTAATGASCRTITSRVARSSCG
jgi:signal peptidase I